MSVGWTEEDEELFADNAKAKPNGAAAEPLETIVASSLAGLPRPERRWHVKGWIPARNVTLLSGEGASGKSLLALQLAISTALGTTWCGLPVARGPALYLSAEDEVLDGEMHIRVGEICDAMRIDMASLDQLEIAPLAGKDALLAIPEARSDVIRGTALWHRLVSKAQAMRPRLLLLDTLNDVFGGNEIVRTQARQFVGMVRGLAIEHDLTAVIIAHPSLTGIDRGTGSSGSTGWGNSVRSRIYLKREKEGDEEPDSDVRVMTVNKINFGRSGVELRLRWEDGIFVSEEDGEAVINPGAPLIEKEREKRAERVFMDLLAKYIDQGRDVHCTTGRGYAPKLFSEDEEGAKGITKKQFEGAMNRLFDKGIIKNVPYGPPSKGARRIAISIHEGRS